MLKPHRSIYRRLVVMTALTASAILLLVLLASCTNRNREYGFVYMRLKENPSTLDPAHISSVDSGSIAAKVFNGLVRLGKGLRVEPDIAESWRVSPDGFKYTFTLRDDVFFSSGRKVKSTDFKYSFERVLSPETLSPNTWVFENIKGVEAFMSGETDDLEGISVEDEHTLVIELKEPFSPFLGLLTMPPAYVVPMEQVLHKGPDFSSEPVGTGPFTLDEWRPDRSLRLVRNKGYFGKVPKVSGIIYRVIPEDLTAVAEFESENLHVLTIPGSAYSRYRNSEKWSGYISSLNGLNTYYLGLNNSRPPFDDPEVRRAMNMAVDRKRILSTLYEGRGRIANGPVPDVLRGWSVPEGFPYDPAEARRIIYKKGLKGKRLNFYIKGNDQENGDIAEVIQSYLKEAGLDVVIRPLEWSAYKEAVNKGEPDMFWLSWWADYADPENFLFPLFHSDNHGPQGNRVWYVNEEVDELIRKGQHSPTPERGNEYYSKAEEIIVSEAPWVFFWHRTDYTVRQSYIGDFEINPVYTMDKGTDIHFIR
jgi:peptide/nickel transport system substrate-binding protein/oligopeptide transport system substrate-binding protein